MPAKAREKSLPAAVPLFPLPNVVLFPRAVLPLHIFEERYKAMTADALNSHRQIAMALLRPGWEKDYHGQPEIEPVVCVGTILSHEKLSDGRYNFLLEGHTRATIVEEIRTEPYRLAQMETLGETGGAEAGLLAHRRRLEALFEREVYLSLPGGRQMRELIHSNAPTAVIADLLAFHLLSEVDVRIRQQFLAEADIDARVAGIVAAVAALAPLWRNSPRDAGMN